MKSVKHLGMILVFLCALPIAALAQVGGSIDGTVTDPNGAVVPGAKVTATQVATGFKTTVETTQAGLYAFPLLHEGPYTITVTQAGFKTFVREGIEVRVGLTETIDMKLELGTVQQTVDVKAAAPLLETNNATRGTNISPQTLDMLPLFNGGNVRQANVFMGYMPGVNGGSAGDVSIEGSEGRGTEVMIDGGSIISPESGGISFYFPGFEPYGEFKIITSGFNAENGRTGGGIEEFVTKSGTNDVHGSAFFNFERQFFNAVPWLTNASAAARSAAPCNVGNPIVPQAKACRPKTRYNDEGGAAGGPIVIPHVYDGRNKSFFYFTYEGYWQPAAVTVNSGESTPTAAMVQGNFAGLAPIYDPATTGIGGNAPGVRTQFPNNAIPAARFSTISKNILQYVQAPNTGGGGVNPQGNFTYNSTTVVTSNDWSIKVDHTIRQNHHIAFFYTHQHYDSNTDLYFPGPLSNGGESPQSPHQWRLSHDWTMSPHALLHNFFSASLDNVATNTPLQAGYGCKLGFTNDLCGSHQDSTPVIAFQTDLTMTAGGDLAAGSPFTCSTCLTWGQDAGKVNNAGQLNRIWMGGQTLTWVRNKHEFKMGWEIRRSWTMNNDWSGTNGNYLFHQAQTEDTAGDAKTGNAFASFLLGDVNQASAVGLPVFFVNTRYAYTAGFFQDTWRIKPRLTVNLGIRYEVPIGWHNAVGNYSDFNPTLPNPQAGNLPGAMQFMGFGPGHTGSLRPYPTDFSDIGPRAGFAYQLTSKTVIRSGFGIWYEGLGNGGITSRNDGFGGGAFSQAGDGFDPTFNWDKNPNGTPGVYPPAGFKPAVQYPGVDNFGSGTPDYMGPNFARAARVYDWNFTVQHQYKNWLFEVAFAGNRTHGAPSSDYFNTVPDADLFLTTAGPGTTALPSNMLAYSFNNPTQAAYLNSMGYYSPSGNGSLNPSCGGWTTCWTTGWSSPTLAQSLRTFPQMGLVYSSNSGRGWLAYDSAQVKVEHRFGDLNFESSYVRSKTLSADAFRQIFGYDPRAGFQDPSNYADAKSFSNEDVPNVVNFTLSYALPFGNGKKFLGNSHGVVNKLAGGWTAAGLGQYRTGFLIELLNPQNNLNTYLFWPQTKVTSTGAPLKTGVADSSLDPNNPNSRWFTTTSTGTSASFSTTPVGVLGNQAWYNNQFRQPWYRYEAISLNKNIGIYGEGKVYLRYTINAFNPFNRSAMGGIGGTINSTNFGRVTGPQVGARAMSMGLRLYF